jgi:predicted small secreted protein
LKKFILLGAILFVSAFTFTGCGESDADVAAKNISKAAEQFEVARRIVFFNGITDKYILTIEGYCSVESSDSALGGSLEVTCKTGKNKFKKSFLGLSDNVSYIVEQVDPIGVSTTRYRVIFKPETIVPNIDRP